EVPGAWKWGKIDNALRLGLRTLPGGSSLAQLLYERRGVRNVQSVPPLTHETVLAWADQHHERIGNWPNENSGPVPDAPGEVWANVNAALREGLRGLPGGSSLALLIPAGRGVRNQASTPPAGRRADPGVGRRLEGPNGEMAKARRRPAPRRPRRDLGRRRGGPGQRLPGPQGRLVSVRPAEEVPAHPRP